MRPTQIKNELAALLTQKARERQEQADWVRKAAMLNEPTSIETIEHKPGEAAVHTATSFSSLEIEKNSA
jgi:hypothetical protein